MRAEPRVFVLVEGRAVEARQRVRVLGKVRRHPVQDHADAALMQLVDHGLELIGVAVPGGGREVPGDPITPGAAGGVFRQGKELDVGETHPLDVVAELAGGLLPRQRAASLFDHAAPGAEMDFVDRHGSAENILLPPPLHPLLVAPEIPVELVDHRGGGRRDFRPERVRVRFQQLCPATARTDLELVPRTAADVGDEQLPDAGRAHGAHLVEAAVPGVEIAHHRYRARGRRPDGERGPVDSLVVPGMRAEPLPDPLVASLGDEVRVQLAERGRKAVGVAQREAGAAAVIDLQQIAEYVLAPVQARLEDTALAVARGDLTAEVRQHRHSLRVGTISADHNPVAVRMDAQDGMRIGVPQLDELLDLPLDLRRIGWALHGSPPGAPGGRHSMVSPSRYPSRNRSPAGIATQSGRWPTSYRSS